MLGRQYALLPGFSTAAAVAFFSLERKETKVQGKGHASTRRPDSQSRNPLPGPKLWFTIPYIKWF